MSIKMLNWDLKQLQQEQLHLLDRGAVVARKMGFPEIIMPGETVSHGAALCFTFPASMAQTEEPTV